MVIIILRQVNEVNLRESAFTYNRNAFELLKKYTFANSRSLVDLLALPLFLSRVNSIDLLLLAYVGPSVIENIVKECCLVAVLYF